MPDLARFQQAFAAALLDSEPQDRLARSSAFAVYRNTCALGAVEALRATYRTVDCLLGEEAFTAVALAFRGEQPPSSPILAGYGAGFPAFLGRQPWTGELPYLADVALIDRLWLEAHLAADPAPPAPPATPARPAAPLRLALHPAARFAWLETPAVTIWLAHRGPAGFDCLEPEWQAEGALLTRRAGAVRLRPIRRAEHRLLALVAAGAPLRGLDEALGRDTDLPRLIAGLISAGAIFPL